MSEHPIRLVLEDDLERARFTVLLRWLLAIPHYLWLIVWSVAVIFAVIASWFATLVRGRTPDALHRFLAAYVKYATQLYGYLYLAANPYPSFDGGDGYPIDLVIVGPAPQSRWKVAFRVILVIPASVFATTLVGLPGWSTSGGTRGKTSSLGFTRLPDLVLLAAVLGWFAVLARGRMPRGLRDLIAYGISYGAQVWGYALLLTDRYPNSDPQAALADIPVRHDPAWLEVDGVLERSRLTVFFRALLAIPHFVWLLLWGILVFLAAIANWFAVLFTGRVPEALGRFLSAYLRYQFHVYGFLYLLANPFPGFVGAAGSYPLEAVLETPGRQRRWTVLLRVVLAFPAMALTSAFGAVLSAAALLGWFASLATGRMPLGLRNAGMLALRYQLQTTAYLMVLYDAYPYSGPAIRGEPAEEEPPSAQAISAFG